MNIDKDHVSFEVRITGLTEAQARKIARQHEVKKRAVEVWVDAYNDNDSMHEVLYDKVHDSTGPATVDVEFRGQWNGRTAPA